MNRRGARLVSQTCRWIRLSIGLLLGLNALGAIGMEEIGDGGLPGRGHRAGGTTVARALGFEDRVSAQRAIEQVTWNHRTWPKENPGPKPTLAAVMPEDILRARVEDSLKKSAVLESFWHRPVTAGQLQAEMSRMASGTRDPEMLRELFAALGDDPRLIAETLARQTLVDRLVRSWYSTDDRIHGGTKQEAIAALARARRASDLRALGGLYTETTYVLRNGTTASDALAHGGLLGDPKDRKIVLDSEDWTDWTTRLAAGFGVNSLAETVTGRPSGLQEDADRFFATVLLSKHDAELSVGTVVWPKRSFDSWWQDFSTSDVSEAHGAAPHGPGALATNASEHAAGEPSFTMPAIGGSGTCTDDTWQLHWYVPGPRESGHSAIWTGSEMIVWGGDPMYLNTGGRYSPATDTWMPTSIGTNVPTSRWYHTAVWTGTEMIVWGGQGSNFDETGKTGGRYSPATDTWLPTSTGANVPAGRTQHSAVWTGSEMVVWGGRGTNGTYLISGGRFAPASDTWIATSTAPGVPAGRSLATAVWTGSEMIVWGGYDGSQVGTGARYAPAADTWAPMSSQPTPRYLHTAVWTGTEMIVWGGYNGAYLNEGGRYTPGSDSWLPTSTGANVPAGRPQHSAVWTGSEMIVWGGNGQNSGGRYAPSTDTWLPTSTSAGVPAGRSSHTAVWTGTEMIVWAGRSSGAAVNTGGRYAPATDSWVPTSGSTNVPTIRQDHSQVWTGTEMIVWGGATRNGPVLNTGGRYVPATDTWTATSQGANVPTPRTTHATIWTGTEMIVWGGATNGGPVLNSGGRYAPSTDTWLPTSTATGVPVGRSDPSGVWTGTDMIVWGGATNVHLNSGGRYRPSTDTWTPTSTGTNVPAARRFHTAVWSGTEMIVWGGYNGSQLGTGARYAPATDTWATMASGVQPTPRYLHTAVWTGTEMIVWGGFSGAPYENTGARYSPFANTWVPTSTGANVPDSRCAHSAVWTGTEMIVWAGQGFGVYRTGGRYVPSTDTWSATSTGPGTPEPRYLAKAIWTDSRMIVWGGGPYTNELGLYCAGCRVASTSSYRDADGDGYGNPGISTVTNDCTVPAGYVVNPYDCDDVHGTSYPGASEVCDGVRSDCSAPGWPAIVDADSDSTENVCDPCPADPANDSDGDGVCGDDDNCAGRPNAPSDCDANPGTPAVQCDLDADGVGDVCDNCLSAANLGQFDTDHDGTGNACDADNDGDGTPNAADDDDDNDGVREDDGDGTADPCPHLVTTGCDDNCPLDSDPRQTDTDHDGEGDVCDLDDGTVNGGITGGAIGPVLRFSSGGSPTLSWVRESGALGYNVYRGTISALPAGAYGACYRSHISTTYALLAENPPAGAGHDYLVTAVMQGGEGSLGTRSNGVPRPNASPCP